MGKEQKFKMADFSRLVFFQFFYHNFEFAIYHTLPISFDTNVFYFLFSVRNKMKQFIPRNKTKLNIFTYFERNCQQGPVHFMTPDNIITILIVTIRTSFCVIGSGKSFLFCFFFIKYFIYMMKTNYFPWLFPCTT